MKTKKLFKEIRKFLHDRFGDDLNKVIMFGSRVRGTHHDYSDYDILIVVNGDYDWRKKDEILDAVCDLNIQYDILIDAHIISTGELMTIRGKQPFIQNAIESGISI